MRPTLKKVPPNANYASDTKNEIEGNLFLFAFFRNVRQIVGTAADRRIGRPATRDRTRIAAIDASRRQSLAVNGLDQYPRDLLRQRPVLRSSPPTQRFL